MCRPCRPAPKHCLCTLLLVAGHKAGLVVRGHASPARHQPPVLYAAACVSYANTQGGPGLIAPGAEIFSHSQGGVLCILCKTHGGPRSLNGIRLCPTRARSCACRSGPATLLGTGPRLRLSAPRGTLRNAASPPMSWVIGLVNRRTPTPSDITLPTPPSRLGPQVPTSAGSEQDREMRDRVSATGHRSMAARQLRRPNPSSPPPVLPGVGKIAQIAPAWLRSKSLPPLAFGKFWTEHSGSEDAPLTPQARGDATSQHAHDAGRRWERRNCVAVLLLRNPCTSCLSVHKKQRKEPQWLGR